MIMTRKRFQKCMANTSRNPQRLLASAGDFYIYVSLNVFPEISIIIFLVNVITTVVKTI